MTTQSIEYATPTATCGGCRDRIQRAFATVDGVTSVTVDLTTRRTTIVFDPEHITPRQLIAVLTEAGYAPDPS